MGGGDLRHQRPSPSTKMAVKSNRKTAKRRFTDYLHRTNLDIFLIGIIMACYHVSTAYANASTPDSHGSDEDGSHATTDSHASSSTASDSHGDDVDDHGGVLHGDAHDDEHTEHEILSEEHREVYALLFPWFMMIVGVCGYYFISRYAHQIPYTAFMFLIGASIGFATNVQDGMGAGDHKLVIPDNEITFSAQTWLHINGEVLLLVFLPGLLYLDSYHIDVKLFVQSFFQLLTFAFPMVLAGTALTALVALYIFPYGWPWELCFTFGSILAATDPVAVAVLLNELGAPPRLKIHVSGESLLNDGSAVVFYKIFSNKFYYLIGVDGVGQDIGWGLGFAMFFQLSLGGACIGIAFGLGLLIILYNLNRKLSGEDSVVQVAATITTAYLSFWTSEILCSCSGIIAVVFTGIIVKGFGETFYNDAHLSHHFWEITEWLLNTLLFALGGCLWGVLVLEMSLQDWGYLFILFGLVIVIRFFLVFAFYPLTANIGIGTNWRESVFMAYGGLRGAVGIALALSLFAETKHFTAASEVSAETREEFREYARKVFAMVGGIALLTLTINAPTCGPVLKMLGIITPTETREKIVQEYDQHMKESILKEFVVLLTQERFKDVDFPVVKKHVSLFREVTYQKLMDAVKKHKDSSPASSYTKPNLENILPYLMKEGDTVSLEPTQEPEQPKTPTDRLLKKRNRAQSVANIVKKAGRTTVYDHGVRYDDLDSRVQEERMVFLQILHGVYHSLMESGELEPRSLAAQVLLRSVVYAEDAAQSGQPLGDWDALESSGSIATTLETTFERFEHWKLSWNNKSSKSKFSKNFFIVQLRARQIITFLQAHKLARQIFKEEFSQVGRSCLTSAEETVLDESSLEVDQAKEALADLPKEDLAVAESLLLCSILLNKSANYFNKLAHRGLMSPREAGEFLEHIEENLKTVRHTSEIDRTKELSTTAKRTRMSQVDPQTLGLDPELTKGLLSGS